MLKFRNSNLSKLISSLEDFKTVSRKFSQIQSKVFRNLDEWASESNNTAINVSHIRFFFLNIDPSRIILIKKGCYK